MKITFVTERLASDQRNPVGEIKSNIVLVVNIFESTDFSITIVIDVHGNQQLNVFMGVKHKLPGLRFLVRKLNNIFVPTQNPTRRPLDRLLQTLVARTKRQPQKHNKILIFL